MKLPKPLHYIGAGIVVGVANIIPGVSGGTMAVILGVFDRMVEALGLKRLRKNIGFLLLFGVGAAAGILAFSGVLNFLMTRYPVATPCAFIGLILGGLPMIFKRAGGKNFRVFDLLPFLGGLAVMAGMYFLPKGGAGTAAAGLTFPLFFLLLAAALISTFCMILPGISGSMMLVVLGQYYTVIAAIDKLKDLLLGNVTFRAALPTLLLLLPVGIGVLLGLIFGSRLVNFLLTKNKQATYSAILGLIVGSLFVIFPRFHGFNLESVVAVLLLLAGMVITFLFSRKEKA